MSIDSYKRAQEARRAMFNRGCRYLLDTDGSEDRAVAQHEAAHALTGQLLGLTPRHVTVEPNHCYGGMTAWASEPDRAFETIVALMAGNEGEKLFGGGSDNGCKGDLSAARALADSISDDVDGTIKRARRAARKILKANFVPLTKLAIALLDRRTLDLAEIEEVIAVDEPDDDASGGRDDDAAPSIFDRDVILARMLDRQRQAFDRDHGCDVILTRLLDPKVVHTGSPGWIL